MFLANTEYLVMKKLTNSLHSKEVKKTALEEWRTHDPFQRASTSLIRRVDRELKELKRTKQEPGLF